MCFTATVTLTALPPEARDGGALKSQAVVSPKSAPSQLRTGSAHGQRLSVELSLLSVYFGKCR